MHSSPPFGSPPPQVRLVSSFHRPFDNAIAAARTCYSSMGIVLAEDVRNWPRRDELARSLYAAGHHTVLQHAHFQFSMANVSRQFVWTFLHSHPFYNSEQVSQRYVEVKAGSYIIPPLEGKALSIYERTVERQFKAYQDLIQALNGPVSSAYFDRFRARRHTPNARKVQDDIRKRCMEAARYVLPIGTFTQLYHTINGLTLLRYHRLRNQWDTPTEQTQVVGMMVEELLKAAPEYRIFLADPLPLDGMPEQLFFRDPGHKPDRHAVEEFIREFDVDLGGRVSLLVDYKVNNEKLLADSVREILGVPSSELDDAEAMDRALNPARNPLMSDNLNLTTLSKLTRALIHPSYTFRKKLSHTADSQNQRHRTTPATRPCLPAYLTPKPDYITPEIIRRDDRSRKIYDEVMAASWDGINQLRDQGVADEFAAYLLPNSVAIRMTESADLLNLRHKCAMRLCYNAQEEIWRAALDEAEQVAAINPRIGQYLLPPCGLRALSGARPTCPEGVRYCGVPLWKMQRKDYSRLI
jgi:flavin-dependent thymidylate synthase